jgi:hypothetical protein
MTDSSTLAPNCAGCAFWGKLRGREGVCCRHAPKSSHRPEEVAHFPMTHGHQWCGDGSVGLPFSIGCHCVDCVFWRRPELGLNPVNRGDMPMAWWARAGLCARQAPQPAREPGPRAFWRATLDTDFCGEGMARKSGGGPRGLGLGGNQLG